LPDGRLQIVDLLLPGDSFGFGARIENDFTVEAIVKGIVVARYPRRKVELLAEHAPQVGIVIRQFAFEAISRSHTQALTLGRVKSL
jgi:CRP-like cAMP-binding protein